MRALLVVTSSPQHSSCMHRNRLLRSLTHGSFSRQAINTMNRPRNRQPRPPRDNQRTPRRGPPQTGSSNVPTVRQVVPGATVSIILKADQPTGREVQGVVQDLLTRGDHPRGIKVRLQDGRVGRVQRMSTASEPREDSATTNLSFNQAAKFGDKQNADRYQDESAQEPPLRSLADFIPGLENDDVQEPPSSERTTFSSATSKCPICGKFEGDEIAVSHHVDEHFS